MFELKESTVEAFISDTKIMLPRFQRKQTWNEKKNFELCISLYKDYPLGVVVINVEEEEESGKYQKWLLDGRQRRNALLLMENPEEIYKWAKSFIGFKVNFTEEELTKSFWEKIDEFLDDDDDSDEQQQLHNEDSTDGENSIDDIDENDSLETDSDIEDALLDQENETDIVEDTVPIRPNGFRRGDLKRLLDVILMVHPIRGKQSGLTRPFDFSKYVGGLDFIEESAGKEIVNIQELLLWIEYKKETTQKRGHDYPPTQEQFYDWITQRMSLIKTDQVIKREIDRRWGRIENAFAVLESLKLQIKEGKIGYIQLKNTDDNDAKKIFELINKAGTPLEAAEILSAKPSWNVAIANASDEIKENVKELYKDLGVKQPEDVVKWDIAATVLKRLDIDFIL